ncbi:Serine/threonine-protein kinase TNNI3K [Strongyloides ratti]|uniref:Serine/threonine-protein kinase TNNI3K n=1 Tax=Strongyloides ratti TaxID=34506 RepID=A0A090LAP8_STRRB|nr:Serine/threonine-protein kinase TNNI3K [Strongyloides ratti]CEF66827.1 Serine/threonine-protein kinase TNNI3K [Strongyloides ratti]
MGNYKSRPHLTCTDELKKRISESYSIVRSKLNEDSKPRIGQWSPLQQAVFQGSLKEVQELYNDKKQLQELCPCREITLLHIASISHHPETKEKLHFLLTEASTDDTLLRSLITKKSKNGYTALHTAIYKNDISIVEILLSFSFNPNEYSENIPPPLHLASMSGNAEMVSLLITSGADVHSSDFVHFTPLHSATYFAHEKVVETLLKYGSDPNYSGGIKDCCLHISASKGNLPITKLLLNGGSDPFLYDDEGNNGLHFASKSGHVTLMECVLKKVSPNQQDLIFKTNIYGDTSLHTACYAGKLDCAKRLFMIAGSSILTIENSFSETPLMAACTAGKSIELVAFLLRQPGVDPNYQGKDGHSALHSACYHGHIRIVQYLLDNGADQNIAAKSFDTDNGGSYYKPNSVFSLMKLDSNNSLNTSSKSSSLSGIDDNSYISQAFQTPIFWAYEKGHDQIVALLKYYASKKLDSDVGSEYSSGSSSYIPLPSPIGKLRSMTKEKTEILQLRARLPLSFQVSLLDVELQEVIGSGSFGKVYKGIYRGMPVAIKKYKAISFGAKTEVDMFCREVTILYQMKHPNIVGFIGACLDDPSRFSIITEYVSGGSLFSLIHKQKLNFEMILKLSIGVDIAKGMRYLHEKTPNPVLHRDLNSHNILLHGDGRAVISDFGESRFSRQYDNDDHMTKQPGNLRWMAPEVFTQCSKYDQKVDVFSFSLVLWEIHSSELPFSHLKPAAAAAEMAYKRSRPSLPSYPTNQFPDHIIKVISMAWNQEPTQRPTFAEIITILEKHIDKENRYNFNIGNITSIFDDLNITGNDDVKELYPIGNVSNLTTQWERRLLPDVNPFGINLKETSLQHIDSQSSNTSTNSSSSKTIEALRQRLDSHGYVSQAAKAISAAKNASALRDSFILARGDSVAKRQSNFEKDDEILEINSTFASISSSGVKTGSEETLKEE